MDISCKLKDIQATIHRPRDFFFLMGARCVVDEDGGRWGEIGRLEGNV